MLSIILWTLWRRRWYIMWWSVGLAAYMALVVGAYPPFRDQAASLNQALGNLPDAVKSLVTDTGNLFSPVGYMSSNAYYIVLPIILSVMSVGLGSSLIAGDEEDHTLELVLSRPISRGKVLAARALAGLCIILVASVVTALATILFAALTNLGINALELSVTTGASMLVALLFGTLAFTLTAIRSSLRPVSIGLATLLLVASYLFTSLSSTVDWLKWPAKLLPYNYYHPSDMLNGTYHWRDLLGMVVVVALLMLLAHLSFRRRDIA